MPITMMSLQVQTTAKFPTVTTCLSATIMTTPLVQPVMEVKDDVVLASIRLENALNAVKILLIVPQVQVNVH